MDLILLTIKELYVLFIAYKGCYGLYKPMVNKYCLTRKLILYYKIVLVFQYHILIGTVEAA